MPTWNYAIVQARGVAARCIDQDWLAAQVAALTASQEAGRAEPWAVSDAPAPFVASQLRAIVGHRGHDRRHRRQVEDEPEPAAGRSGQRRRGLEAAGDPVALETAGLVRRFGGLAATEE